MFELNAKIILFWCLYRERVMRASALLFHYLFSHIIVLSSSFIIIIKILDEENFSITNLILPK